MIRTVISLLFRTNHHIPFALTVENHYSQNVNLRRTVQEDIRAAKELQDEEDRKAKIRTLDEEDQV